MLLIHPPLAKPSEPPAGIAKLSGALSAHNIPHQVLDANIEGLLSIMKQPRPSSDTWTRRAIKNLSNNIAALRDFRTYHSFDRYSRAVKDVNHILTLSGRDNSVIMGLADYQHQHLSPLRSADLIRAAEHPEKNPFYSYFEKRLTDVIERPLSPRSREGHEGNLGGNAREKQSKMQIVGFSLNYLSQALCTFAMIGFIRKEYPCMKIVLGGGLVSSWMRRPGWKNPFGNLVDHLIAGPGEQPLLDLFSVIGREQKYTVPDYDSTHLHDYLSPGFILPYSASSGCYWNNCSFCPEKAENNRYVPLPAHQAMADLNFLIEKDRPVLVHLLDNAINPALMHALVASPLDVPWYGFARISKELLDIDYCMRLRRSGCVMLKIGLESGDQGVLDQLQKGIDLGAASQVLRNLHNAGITAYVYLLFGTPPETIVEARKTLDFVVKHANEIRFLNLAVFNMPLCGNEAGEIETERFYEGDLSLYTGFKHPRGWDRKLVRQFLDNEFKKHPAVSAILKKDPPIFTSNHAAFFVRQNSVSGVL